MGGDFVFTGEVLGQRPMSQLRHSMKWIEDGSGLQGRLLRPLCAKLLDPTLPEIEGLIDREKLLRISGRSRKDQKNLAHQSGITDYPNSAGGCMLTHEHFAQKMRDIFKFGYRSFRETISLKWGRHFRINEHFKVILGRDETENGMLVQYAHQDDHIFELKTQDGPMLILKGYNPTQDILETAAGLVQRFSRYKEGEPVEVKYWPVKNPEDVRSVFGQSINEEHLQKIAIAQ